MRKAGVLLWREIEEALVQDIEIGVFPTGSKLPIEGELAARFGVNRHTVRRALAALQERGAISIEQGRGMFVQAPKLAYPIGRRTRFNEIMDRQHRVSGGRLVRSWEGEASSKIADDLQIGVGQSYIAFEDIREVEGEPVSLTTRYFPGDRFKGIAEIFVETKSITRSLQHFGVAGFTRRSTRVHARGATLEEAAALHIPAGSPVLVVDSVNVDADERPVEYGSSRSAGGRFELMFEH